MKNIPENKKLSVIQLLEWISNPIRYMEYNHKRYGDIFLGKLGKNLSLVFTSNPKFIKEIFDYDPESFNIGRVNEIIKPVVGKNSIMLADGKNHRKLRKLMMPPFHGTRVQAYGKIIQKITTEVISQWLFEKPFSIALETQKITINILFKAVFGLKEESQSQKLRQEIVSLLDTISSPIKASFLFFPYLQKDLGFWSPGSKWKSRQERLDRLLYTEIQKRRKNLSSSESDIMTLLLLARDENGNPLTDEELRDELLTLLLAGHETTATAIAWALYWINKYPEVKQKLYQEIESLKKDSDLSCYAKLPYLTAVCKETLRIYPVAPLTFYRVPKHPITIQGYQFEAGTMLTPCIYLTHHREDLYPNPKQFKPERFLERQYSLSEYYPFGGGNRLCIGMALAQYEMKLVLAIILSQFKLSLADNRPIRPVRRGLTIAPSDNLRFVVTGRRTSN